MSRIITILNPYEARLSFYEFDEHKDHAEQFEKATRVLDSMVSEQMDVGEMSDRAREILIHALMTDGEATYGHPEWVITVEDLEPLF